MRYRLLIIEDTKAIIDLLREALLAAYPKLEVKDCGFKSAPQEIEWLRPDIVILDLSEGTDNNDAASPSWEFIWKSHFCPVIIHSAYEASAYQPQKHPFSRYERKTRTSIGKVVVAVKELSEQIEGIRLLRTEIENRIANSLREVGPLVWHESAKPEERREMLVRITRRRVAASLDSSAREVEKIRAIEQFIYPPLETHLLLGDILAKRAGVKNVANTYRAVLSPSCDLIPDAGRYPIENVLLAECVPVTDEEILRRLSLQAGNPNLPGQLGRKLKEDSRSDQFVFPALYGCWPAMVIDLKRTEMAKREKIATHSDDRPTETDFFRVASMDSPFREKLSWRYVETVGRPGLPVLDKASLENDIVAAATPSTL